MSKVSRSLFAVAALLLGLAFVFPLWTIRLQAPQYPEGLGMQIHVNSVEGVQPWDLQNINELNHYIGMRQIDPGSIPELRIMPRILLALIAAGLLVALIGRRSLGWVWLGAFTLLGAAGMVDFYKWEYDYGHHLDLVHAIIKIPGMTYQPPIIGSRQLLNFTAISWPAAGTYALALAGAVAAVALVAVRRPAPVEQHPRGARALVAGSGARA